jgi:hypothetical protein
MSCTGPDHSVADRTSLLASRVRVCLRHVRPELPVRVVQWIEGRVGRRGTGRAVSMLWGGQGDEGMG